MTKHVFDILVIGGGPAGLGTVAALADSQRSLCHLAPEQPPSWPNSYGVWFGDLQQLDLVDQPWADLMSAVWEEVGVDLGLGDGVQSLDAPYCRLDNDKVIDALRQRASGAHVEWMTGWVQQVDPGTDTAVVTTKDQRSLEARLVIDATGHASSFVSRRSRRADATAHQAAWGAWIECNRPPVTDTSMMLMDFRDDFLQDRSPNAGTDAPASDDPDEPSFLYAMHLDGGSSNGRGHQHWFVEETSLAARPPMDFDVLESRLKRRLRARDVGIHRVHDTERVRIPMGGAMPHFDQPIVGIGGAAAMPHPATGYMVVRGWRAAAQLRDALDAVFSDHSSADQPLAARARRAWGAVWSTDEIRARRLYNFGLETLLSLDAEATRQFFAAFFDLPPSDWRAYLSGEASPGTLAGIMWRLFRRASPSTKWHIMGASMSPKASELWRAWRGR